MAMLNGVSGEPQFIYVKPVAIELKTEDWWKNDNLTRVSQISVCFIFFKYMTTSFFSSERHSANVVVDIAKYDTFLKSDLP